MLVAMDITRTGKEPLSEPPPLAEPVFGIIKSVMRFRQFLVRGLASVRGIWTLVTPAWHIKRMATMARDKRAGADTPTLHAERRVPNSPGSPFQSLSMAAIGHAPRYSGRSAFPPPMFSIPASPHFVGQDLWVEAQKLCHLGAVFSEEDQIATLPVLPSRPVDSKLVSRLPYRRIPAKRLHSCNTSSLTRLRRAQNDHNLLAIERIVFPGILCREN
ncbi:MAG: hypothetical protein ACYC9Z_01720 [Casimicrobiaceae bacterium]